MIAAEGYRGDNVFFIARNDYTNGNLTVIGAVGCVEGAAAGIEADFAAKMAAEGGFEGDGVEMGGGFGRHRRHRTSSRMRGAGCKGRIQWAVVGG